MRLLLVEDEPDLARALRKSLEEACFAVDVAADALYRCAAEAVRQHERVAKLNERGVHHTEMSEASALRDLSHQHLRARGDLYEMAAAAGRGGHEEAYWHAANGMWHAAREYCRRNEIGRAHV